LVSLVKKKKVLVSFLARKAGLEYCKLDPLAERQADETKTKGNLIKYIPLWWFLQKEGLSWL
jgi:hypothetical protein